MGMLKANAGYAICILMVGLLSACGGSDSSSGGGSTAAVSYSTTSTKGDYSEWTLTGDQLDATWNVVQDDGTIAYTYNLSATCGAADTYGIRSCTVDSGPCTDGAATCPGSLSGTFDMMEVPGVALFVRTGSGAGRQLHVGFAKDSSACSRDVSGDYTMMRTGLGLSDMFGIYRSDSNFIDVAHADFGFDTPDANVTQTVTYRTGTPTETFADGGCADGVRTRGSGSDTIRSMITANGLFVVDLPAGQGGLLSFKEANAAVLSDFANKTFGGISFPDDGPPEAVRAVSDSVSGDHVDFSASFSGGTSGTLSIQALDTASAATSPSYPDFTAVPAAYSSSPLAADYPDPAAIPGLFKIANPIDSGRIVIAAMKVDDKVVGMGMVYNYRTTSETNPATGAAFLADGLYNTGNFILFER